MTTRVQRNKNMGKLQAGYLFPEVRRLWHALPMRCRHRRRQLAVRASHTPAPACHRPSQIARRRKAHQEAKPEAKIISLGIGDTTEPIPPFIVEAMKKAAEGLGTLEGYSGCAAALRFCSAVGDGCVAAACCRCH